MRFPILRNYLLGDLLSEHRFFFLSIYNFGGLRKTIIEKFVENLCTSVSVRFFFSFFREIKDRSRCVFIYTFFFFLSS